MPDVQRWAGDNFPLATWLDDVQRGVDAARLIAEKPSVITVARGGDTLEPQTVRIEPLGRPRFVISDGGMTVIVEALIIGYRGHPAVADTDLQPGDRFMAGGVAYEIVGLAPALPDRLEAYAQVRR